MTTKHEASGPTRLGPDMTGQKVLVVGLNYSPRNTGIAPYTWQAAEDMQRRGATVQVIAGMPHYPYQAVSGDGGRRLSIDEMAREGVLVNRLRLTVPPLTSRLKRAAYESAFATHVLTHDLPWKPDVVVSVVPSLLGAAAAARIARATGARLVVWVQEFMGPAAARIGLVPRGRGAEVTARIEGRLLRQAHTVIVYNEDVRRYVEDSGVPADHIVVRPEWTLVQLPRGAFAGQSRIDRRTHELGAGSREETVDGEVALAEIAFAVAGREG